MDVDVDVDVDVDDATPPLGSKSSSPPGEPGLGAVGVSPELEFVVSVGMARSPCCDPTVYSVLQTIVGSLSQ